MEESYLPEHPHDHAHPHDHSHGITVAEHDDRRRLTLALVLTATFFVAEVIGHVVPPGTVARLPAPNPGEERRLLQVLFAGPSSTRAVVSEASRRFGLDLNIVSGRIDGGLRRVRAPRSERRLR